MGMNYRPLQRMGHNVSKLAGLLGNKGLRAWRYKIGKAESPECRWCGDGEETGDHLMGGCRVWSKRWPGGLRDIITPDTDNYFYRTSAWKKTTFRAHPEDVSYIKAKLGTARERISPSLYRIQKIASRFPRSSFQSFSEESLHNFEE
ncbi:hypothetical protein BDZ91DRAFT_802472 [Kalaharituber pfeilii]|nr:hypothetical protein BDZ91DRAFT_802472 [Kalaharituber pfeilii]